MAPIKGHRDRAFLPRLGQGKVLSSVIDAGNLGHCVGDFDGKRGNAPGLQCRRITGS